MTNTSIGMCVVVSTFFAFTNVGPVAAQTEAPPPAVEAAPPPAAPAAANSAAGTVRRQNRRQFAVEQKQRNDAEDALEDRGNQAAQNRANAAQNRGNR